jgi:KDO2-lipid IV(A) lauroyltransferase
MSLRDFTSGELATRLGIFFAQHAPRWMGYGAARIGAGIIARRRPEMYWTVRANLRQVVGPEVGDDALHGMVRRLLFHAGQTYYDFFRALGQPPEVVAQAVRIPDTLFDQFEAATSRGRGVLLLGAHMSNFDLTMLAIGARGLRAQALSLADPGEGFRVLNRLRTTTGLEITPITSQTLRAAIRRLKNGGIVLAGVDRPVPQDRELIEFFGRPAYLPVGSARLALMTGAVVFMGCCHHDPAEGYVLEFTGPIEMVRTGDRRQDILTNTRRIAAVLEGYVGARPEQWMMFHRFWPESPAG